MAVGKKLRFEIFKRDSFTCQYCGRTPPTVTLQVDHIVPRAMHGDDTEENLVTSCADCNCGKGANALTSIPRSLADALDDAHERAEQMEQYNQFLLALRQRESEMIEQLGLYWFNQFQRRLDEFVFGPVRVKSIRIFLKQLTAAELFEAIDIAFAKFPPPSREDDGRTWRYFCGIAWNKVRDRRQELSPHEQEPKT